MALNPNSVVGTAVNNAKDVGGSAWGAGKQVGSWVKNNAVDGYKSAVGTGAASKGVFSRVFQFCINTIGDVTKGSFDIVRNAFDTNTRTGRIARPLLIIGALVAVWKIGESVVDKIRHKSRAEASLPAMQEAADRIAAAEARIERAQAISKGHDFSYLGASHPAHGKSPEQWRSAARGQVPAELGQG